MQRRAHAEYRFRRSPVIGPSLRSGRARRRIHQEHAPQTHLTGTLVDSDLGEIRTRDMICSERMLYCCGPAGSSRSASIPGAPDQGP